MKFRELRRPAVKRLQLLIVSSLYTLKITLYSRTKSALINSRDIQACETRGKNNYRTGRHMIACRHRQELMLSTDCQRKLKLTLWPKRLKLKGISYCWHMTGSLHNQRTDNRIEVGKTGYGRIRNLYQNAHLNGSLTQHGCPIFWRFVIQTYFVPNIWLLTICDINEMKFYSFFFSRQRSMDVGG